MGKLINMEGKLLRKIKWVIWMIIIIHKTNSNKDNNNNNKFKLLIMIERKNTTILPIKII